MVRKMIPPLSLCVTPSVEPLTSWMYSPRNHDVPTRAEVIEKDVDAPSNGTPSVHMVGDLEVSNLHVLYVVQANDVFAPPLAIDLRPRPRSVTINDKRRAV